MNILIIGKDISLFQTGASIPSDTRKRHQLYAKSLREQYGKASTLRIIGYTPNKRLFKVECLDDIISVSARRWEKHGFFMTNFLYSLMSALFSMHIPFGVIKYLYKDKR